METILESRSASSTTCAPQPTICIKVAGQANVLVATSGYITITHNYQFIQLLVIVVLVIILCVYFILRKCEKTSKKVKHI